ncbi:MAG TPA: hypothetical protein VLY03_09705 [Bacteroidota bacterium]|nr:hypothetical protein [Bacteroidota bacterium]
MKYHHLNISDRGQRHESTVGRKIRVTNSFWVILGFTAWFGFFLGAVILHAMAK